MLDVLRERIDNKIVNAGVAATKSLGYRLTERRRLLASRREGGWVDDGRVSVVIPTFNRKELLLNRSLPSVQAQSHSNLEILVAVHGNLDDTAAVVRALGDPRVVVLEVPRHRLGYPNKAEYHWLAGPTRPINAGLEAASGSWIARIDDDDIWKQEHVSRSLEFARDGDFEFVSSSYLARTPTREWVPVPEDGIGGVQTWVYRSSLRFFGANIDAWRKKWNRVNDVDLQRRMADAGVRMGFREDCDPQVVVESRPGESDIGSAAYISNASRIEAEMGRTTRENRVRRGRKA